MNKKASKLGMTNTCFRNPMVWMKGITPPPRYGKACRGRDEKRAIRPLILSKVAKTGKSGSNHNKLLWKYPDGPVLRRAILSAGRSGYVQKEQRDPGLRTLNGSDDWNDHRPVTGPEPIIAIYPQLRRSLGSLPVISGEKARLCCNWRDVRLLHGSGDQAEIKISLPRFVYAPVAAYEKAGEASILVNGKLVDKIDIVYSENVPVDSSVPLTFWEKVKRSWRLES